MHDSTGRASFEPSIRAARDSKACAYVFEDFELRTETCELFRSGRATGLHLKPTRLLLYLIENREHTVPKEELLRAIWPDSYISESAFTTTIGHIRQALDDDGDSQRLIRTFRGRGYRFTGAVERHGVESTPEDAEEAAEAGQRLLQPSHQRKAHRRVRPGFAVVGGIALSLLIAAVVWWYRATEAPPDPVQGLAFEERDWVLIASFDNRTGEAVFDGTIEYALERELSNSRFVNVIPRVRIEDTLKLMKKPLDARVDATLGREVSLRDGEIRAMLTGRVEKFEQTYLLSTALVNPVDGVTVTSFSEEAGGQHAVVTAVRRLANRVRESLCAAQPGLQGGSTHPRRPCLGAIRNCHGAGKIFYRGEPLQVVG